LCEQPPIRKSARRSAALAAGHANPAAFSRFVPTGLGLTGAVCASRARAVKPVQGVRRDKVALAAISACSRCTMRGCRPQKQRHVVSHAQGAAQRQAGKGVGFREVVAFHQHAHGAADGALLCKAVSNRAAANRQRGGHHGHELRHGQRFDHSPAPRARRFHARSLHAERGQNRKGVGRFSCRRRANSRPLMPHAHVQHGQVRIMLFGQVTGGAGSSASRCSRCCALRPSSPA
jgi:hypothetical protein